MNDFQRRRLLAALKDDHVITVSEEPVEVTYVQRYGTGIQYRRPNGSYGFCALDDFEFDIGQLTEEDKVELERGEMERRDTFTNELPKRLRAHTFEAIDVHTGNREAYERCRALEYGRNLFIQVVR